MSDPLGPALDLIRRHTAAIVGVERRHPTTVLVQNTHRKYEGNAVRSHILEDVAFAINQRTPRLSQSDQRTVDRSRAGLTPQWLQQLQPSLAPQRADLPAADHDSRIPQRWRQGPLAEALPQFLEVIAQVDELTRTWQETPPAKLDDSTYPELGAIDASIDALVETVERAPAMQQALFDTPRVARQLAL